MTINHNDRENPASSQDYSEPDATTMLVDCLCGNAMNELALSAVDHEPKLTVNDYEQPKGIAFLVFRGECSGDGCHRPLELRVGAKAQSVNA